MCYDRLVRSERRRNKSRLKWVRRRGRLVKRAKSKMLIEQYRAHVKDTGSPEVQIAFVERAHQLLDLASEIATLKDSCVATRVDHDGQQAPQALDYLNRRDPDRYREIVERLCLRKWQFPHRRDATVAPTTSPGLFAGFCGICSGLWAALAPAAFPIDWLAGISLAFNLRQFSLPNTTEVIDPAFDWLCCARISRWFGERRH